jgi:succinate-semialdehyde dehydrogenase/glutarate-semialdehyde dehydrogenase
LIEDSAIEKYSAMCRCAGQGRQALVGGHKLGQFFEPTVISEATADMRQRKTFGSLRRYFSFKLSRKPHRPTTRIRPCELFLQPRHRASTAVAEALEHGMVGINAGVIATEHVPFGGVKQSAWAARLYTTAWMITSSSSTCVCKTSC